MSGSEFLAALSPHLFWDVAAEGVDAERHANFLIPRVMDRGRMEDVERTWAFYGEARIQEALLRAPSLHRKTLCFFAAQFGVSRETFRASRPQAHWEA